MRLSRLTIAAFLVLLSLACIVPYGLARKKPDSKKSKANANDPRRALHALNRLTFGPRPGDVQQVMAMGVDKWIDLQLHPERIDDSALEARLEPLRTVRMSTRQIAEEFPDPPEINQVMNGKRAMPSDAALRAIYEVQLARLQDRKDRKEDGGKNVPAAASSAAQETAKQTAIGKVNAGGAISGAPNEQAGNEQASGDSMNRNGNFGEDKSVSTPEGEASMGLKSTNQGRDVDSRRSRDEATVMDPAIERLRSLPPDQRFKTILSMPVSLQVEFANSTRGGKGQEFFDGLSPRQKETLLAMNNPGNVMSSELAQAKILRAVYSQRQLEEVMTDFWINHFNVYMEKGLDRMMLASYERDVIRPHAMGKFEDLLVATAKSPAMLFYLDNWLSVGPNSAQAQGIPRRGPGRYGQARPNKGKRSNGLNENYGRELLELHTLSVNGGYSQHDVTEVAKVFTGWTIDNPAFGGGFKFEPRMHEPGAKTVMGKRIKENGEKEGLEVLHRLATSPRTAHFISRKLAERFVSDEPPPALVDAMAQTFIKKKGDIREVLLTLFHSPEFWDDSNYRVKVKTPLEFVASAVRATGAEVEDAMPLTRQLNNMGMPMYGAQPPTGYSMKAETWVSSSALLTRMNFALALTNGKIRGVRIDLAEMAGSGPGAQDSAAVLSTLEGSLLVSGVSKQTHDSIAAQVQGSGKNPGRDVSMIAGLLLGSPEFQRR